MTRSPFRRRWVAGLISAVIAAALTTGPPEAHTSGSGLTHAALSTAPVVDAKPTVVDATAASAVGSGFQGTFHRVPTARTFPFRRGAVLAGPLLRGDRASASSPSATDIPFQRMDVRVGEGASSSLSWSGTVDPARSVTLRAWNGTRWEPLDTSRGQVDGSVELGSTVRPRHVHDGIVPIMVTGRDPFADDIPHPVRPSFEDPASYDFALAHVTDTQYLSEGAVAGRTRLERTAWRRAYTDTMHWIARNADGRKIAFAAHTGDLVQNWQYRRDDRARARRELATSSSAQRILDRGGVVNSVLPGNHDNQSGGDGGRSALFNDYFGPRRYAALARSRGWRADQATHRPWRPGDNSNNYVLFSASGLDFIAVSLGFAVTTPEAAWADAVLERYADRNAILLTHAYNAPSTRPDGRGGGSSFDGHRVRRTVVARNRNVFLVLSGHEHGVNIQLRRDLGREGNHVVELLADYQFYEVPAGEVGLAGSYAPRTRLQMGSSFFRLLQFDVDRSEVTVDTYSPFLDDFGATEYDGRHRYDGTEDDFRIPVQLQHRSTSFVTDSLAVEPVAAVSSPGR